MGVKVKPKPPKPKTKEGIAVFELGRYQPKQKMRKAAPMVVAAACLSSGEARPGLR